ncbi:hypothetical protein ABEB36_012597 [Hypothenemus hampei]|uniref:Uncharacterized protein n=1 Tax=Hypothenemus hampei TaxID=57062 RepID=A0ABD1ECH1_HYPHA
MGLLHISTLILQLSGLWPIEDNKSKLKRTFYKIYSNFLLVWLMVYDVFLSLGFIRLIVKTESFERLNRSLFVFLTTIIIIPNMIIFKQKKVGNLCQDIMIYEKAHVLNTKNPELSAVFQAILKQSNFFTIFTLSTCFVGTSTFIGMSLLVLYNTGPSFWKSDAPFMYELYIPFDKQKYSWFIIIVQILTAYSASLVYVTIQTTFYVLFMYGTLRFQILQLKIDKLSIYGGENSFEKLRSLILEHQDIINFIDTLNEKISYAVMSAFMVNSIKLGSGVFSLIV